MLPPESATSWNKFGKKTRGHLDQQALFNERFHYDKQTGKLFHRHPISTKAYMIAGTEITSENSTGYIRVRITSEGMNCEYSAHYVIWVMNYGEIEEDKQIDHIDHDRKNNRLENLRLVDIFGQRRNMSISKRNKSGKVGVRYDKVNCKWVAEIAGNWLGRFNTFEEAAAARESAEQQLGFHPNHGK